MEYASKELIAQVQRAREFGIAFFMYVVVQSVVGDIPADSYETLAKQAHAVTSEFGRRFTDILKKSTAATQDEAYEVLFSYREKMGPIVKTLQEELRNLGSDENVCEQFDEVFVF